MLVSLLPRKKSWGTSKLIQVSQKHKILSCTPKVLPLQRPHRCQIHLPVWPGFNSCLGACLKTARAPLTPQTQGLAQGTRLLAMAHNSLFFPVHKNSRYSFSSNQTNKTSWKKNAARFCKN